MYLSDQKGMKYYHLHLQMKEQREGHNPGALGLSGWKEPSKKTLVEMYRAGKLKYEQVSRVHDRLKKADHIEALKHGKVTESELEAAGIFVHSKRKGGSKKKISEGNSIDDLKAKLKALQKQNAVLIKEAKEDPSGGRVVQTSIPKTGDWSKSSAEIQQVMREWEIRQAAKEAAEARGKRGFEVKPTEKEAEEMLRRHQDKGRCVIK